MRETPTRWHDGATEKPPLLPGRDCAKAPRPSTSIANSHLSAAWSQERGPYLFTGVIALMEMNSLAHSGGHKWLRTVQMTVRLTSRADTSLSLRVIWNEGRAHCLPCIYHAGLATIINLTCHLPLLHNHLHLQSLPGTHTLFFSSYSFFCTGSTSHSPLYSPQLPPQISLQCSPSQSWFCYQICH